MSTFTQQVFDVVRQIPAGKVLTYKEVADLAGHPRSARAVGTVLSKHFDPAIPCHRVIGKNGSLVGFGAEVWRKKWLLEHEKQYL